MASIAICFLDLVAILIEHFVRYIGSAWGAGTLAGATGARQPSALELEIARTQGEHFYQIISQVKFYY